MPLLMISGYPKSGKTYRSTQLLNYFQSTISTCTDPRASKLKTTHLSDDTLGISRTSYETARDEKIARATFSSAIERALDKDTIVIADGMNYIKGFRYQMYCEAKAASTPSCVVHVGTLPDTCRERNTSATELAYSDACFENLLSRYEEPNGMARWDAPLYTVPDDDEEPPCETILRGLVPWLFKDVAMEDKGVKPHAATVLKPATKADWLQQVDRATSVVLDRIQEWMRDRDVAEAGSVSVPGIERQVDVPVEMPEGGIVSRAVLLRLKRQFITLNRDHDLGSIEDVKRLFVEYLNDSFESS